MQFQSYLKEQPENYFLLNSMLNLEDSELAEMNPMFRNITDKVAMEWLDLMDFKEEQKYEDEGNNPERDTERKRKHNKSKNSRVN